MKKLLRFSSLILLFSIFTGCSVAEDIKDTIDAADCAILIDKLDDHDNETCADALADIKKIESSCGEFLTAETKEQIAFFKANCTDE